MDLVGQTLGSYRILRCIGEGGMGQVYLGEHTAIGKKAAIKVLRQEITDEQTAGRFFNEARAANSIDHPGIIDVYDYGQDPRVGYYLVMDFLSGEPLSTRLLRQPVLSPEQTARLVLRIASPLQAAHEGGIIHRDLKPDNVFLVPDPDNPEDERVVLLDFGIAKLGEGLPVGAQTSTGTLMGTPIYMSPEQCHGAKHVDHRTDIYALGVMAYQLLCGRPPFVAEGFGELIAKHLTESPAPPSSVNPDVPEAMERAVLRALAKDPGERQASAAELGAEMARSVGLPSRVTAQVARSPAAAEVDALGATLSPVTSQVTGPGAAATPATGAPTAPGSRSMVWLFVVSGLVMVGAAVAGVVIWLGHRDAPRAAVRQDAAIVAAPVGAPDVATPDAANPAGCGADPLACYRRALTLWRTAEPRQREQALALQRQICQSGLSRACLWLATQALAQTAYPEAVRWLEQGCTAGDDQPALKCCYNLARLRQRGLGGRRDPARARELLRRACKGGLKQACQESGRKARR